jgi:formylglycine-generating enzyme required for sulfatase activity
MGAGYILSTFSNRHYFTQKRLLGDNPMTKSLTILFLTIIFACFPAIGLANSAPVVSNVSASQRADDSKLVDIYYDLSDADGDLCTVWIAISDNNGLSWSVPAITCTGAVGAGISPGANRHIIWDAGRDVPGKIGDFKARVYADDGKGDPMVLVSAGSYKEDGGANWVFVASYMIGKYEVTNAQYAEFLNDADPTSQHWVTTMEIGRSGSSGSYSYTPVEGKEQYPVLYVSYYDAEAYCLWKSQKTGLNYHIPNKYQWQKAAAWDPVQQKFWTYGYQNTAINCSWCNCYTSVSCYNGTTPVGYFNGTGGRNDARSYYGCYDMSGNVGEWTTEVAQVGGGFISRGGRYDTLSSWCTVTYTNPYGYGETPSTRYRDIGIRLLLDSN